MANNVPVAAAVPQLNVNVATTSITVTGVVQDAVAFGELMTIGYCPAGPRPSKIIGMEMLVWPAVKTVFVRPPLKPVPVIVKLVVPASAPVRGIVTLPDCTLLLAIKMPFITGVPQLNVKRDGGGGGKTSTPTPQLPAALKPETATGTTPPLPDPS